MRYTSGITAIAAAVYPAAQTGRDKKEVRALPDVLCKVDDEDKEKNAMDEEESGGEVGVWTIPTPCIPAVFIWK